MDPIVRSFTINPFTGLQKFSLMNIVLEDLRTMRLYQIDLGEVPLLTSCTSNGGQQIRLIHPLSPEAVSLPCRLPHQYTRLCTPCMGLSERAWSSTV